MVVKFWFVSAEQSFMPVTMLVSVVTTLFLQRFPARLSIRKQEIALLLALNLHEFNSSIRNFNLPPKIRGAFLFTGS